MLPQLPGFNVSVLRQQTSARRGQPVTISGRVSAFGLGLPAVVRVFLEGPDQEPEVRTFDTFAAPLTGDYAVPVLAEKDGRYQVYAQAFPPIGVPLPGAPEPVLLGPPFAESPRPPLAVGEPVDGDLEQDLADLREQVTIPALGPVEVSAPVTFAPVIEFPAPARRAPVVPYPAPSSPAMPDAPASVAVASQVSGRIAAFEIEE